MADQDLVDRVTRDSSEGLDSEESGVDDIIEDFWVSEGKIQYQTVRRDGWNNLCDVKELLHSRTSDILRRKNISLSDEQRSNLREFGAVLDSCWNEETDLFDIEYRTDSDGDLKSLIIPLESSISEDIVIQDVHDENGNFVATEVESQIDFEMYKLWGMDIYAGSLDPDADVYGLSKETRSRVELFSDSIQQRSRNSGNPYGNYESAKHYFSESFATVLVAALMAMISYIALQILGVYALVLVLGATMFGLIPITLLRLILRDLKIGLSAFSDSVNRKGQINKTKLFSTTRRRS